MIFSANFFYYEEMNFILSLLNSSSQFFANPLKQTKDIFSFLSFWINISLETKITYVVFGRKSGLEIVKISRFEKKEKMIRLREILWEIKEVEIKVYGNRWMM